MKDERKDVTGWAIAGAVCIAISVIAFWKVDMTTNIHTANAWAPFRWAILVPVMLWVILKVFQSRSNKGL